MRYKIISLKSVWWPSKKAWDNRMAWIQAKIDKETARQGLPKYRKRDK